MKNILMIATCFPPMGGVGNIRITKYVKYLKKFNWKPTVVTIGEKYITNYDPTLLRDIDDDIEIIKLDLDIKKYKKVENAFYNALKMKISNIIEAKKYDAIFITGGPFEPMKIAPYIYKKYKIPYIIDLRDPWKLQKINTRTKIVAMKSTIKRILIGIQENKIFKSAFSICTVNDTMTKQYQKEYPKFSNKIITISNGYDPADYDNISPKKLDKFSIMYAGKFEVSAGFRDPSIIFKAIKNINKKGYQVQFVHVGQIEKKIIDIAKKENIYDQCEFLGRKTYKEALQYCKGANILLVIGGNEKNEQTGKIFDYIGCKKPIIVLCNEDSEIRIVCKKFESAYCIKKDDIDKICETIIMIYENKNEIREIKEVKEYTRENLTYQLVQILNEI